MPTIETNVYLPEGSSEAEVVIGRSDRVQVRRLASGQYEVVGVGRADVVDSVMLRDANFFPDRVVGTEVPSGLGTTAAEARGLWEVRVEDGVYLLVDAWQTYPVTSAMWVAFNARGMFAAYTI